jgi:predicted dehydrogenase
MQSSVSRRHFFWGALMAGAVPTGGFGSTPSLKAVRYKSPNELLNIAAIGAGGRATANISGCASENIVAFADPDDRSAVGTYNQHPKAATYKDFRKMLDKEGANIDAVIISTPDHFHAVAAYWSMQLGKHVYCEKPLAHTIWEARFLAQAAQKYKVATQMGNQGYSYEGERIAAEIIWSGEIGDVKEVHCWTDRPIWAQGMDKLPAEEKVPAEFDWDVWLWPAAMRPYSPAYCPFNWRGWYDFGSGALGDIACHVWGTANTALLLGGSNCTVEVTRRTGKSPYAFPKSSVTEFSFPARGALGPVKIIWTDGAAGPTYRPEGLPDGEPLVSGKGAFGADGVLFYGTGPATGGTGAGRSGTAAPSAAAAPARAATPPASGGQDRSGSSPYGSSFEGRPINRPDGSGAIFVGTKGCLSADNYGGNIRLLPLARHQAYKLPPQVLTRSPGHYADWIRACKGGEPAFSNFSIAGPFSEIVQLGALATRIEGKLEWASAKMTFTNNEDANKYLKPFLRKGWELKV